MIIYIVYIQLENNDFIGFKYTTLLVSSKDTHRII